MRSRRRAIVGAAREYADAGFDRLYISQIGPAQDEFFDFLDSDLAPALESIDIHRPQSTERQPS